MLRYIHQFVQSFLREASKSSRPKSRKSSRSSQDLAKEKSAVKPEILAIDFTNEGPEAERSKEMIELKRTYSLLMKKFVNPKLDLMTNTKTSSDINILNLKGKQELIRSVINTIFYESTEQQKQLESPAKDLSKANSKVTQEESSVGWSGQRTSKLAATPMVETSSKNNDIASALFSFPETQVGPSRKNVRQTDKFLKHRLKSVDLKDQNVETKKHITTKSKNLVGTDLKTSDHLREIKPEHISVNGTTTTDLNTEHQEETPTEKKEDKICSGNIQESCLLKDISKENLQPSSNMDLNSHCDNNDKSSNQYMERKDLTQYNQKKNINIIRSIAKVDNSKIAKSDTHPLKEQTNDTTKVVKNTSSDQNKVAQKRIDKHKKPIKNVKTCVDQPNLDTGLSKKKEPPNEKKYKEKIEQLTCSNINAEEPLSGSLQNDLTLSPETDKAVKTSDKAMNKSYENNEFSELKSNTNEKRRIDTAMAAGENLSNQNIETLKKEQNQISCKKPEITVCESNEQPLSDNKNQTEQNYENFTNEGVNEKAKSSEDTYWNLISNKLLKTSNDAQKFINKLEIDSWKTKAINTTHALAKDLIGSNISEKQNSEELNNETSKLDNQNIQNSTDVKPKTCVKLDPKGADSLKTQTMRNNEFKAHISDTVPLTKTEEKQHLSNKHLKISKKVNSSGPQVKGRQIIKSSSVDLNPVKATLNTTKSSVHDLKQNNMIINSCIDTSNHIINTHKSNEKQTNLNIPLRKNSIPGNKEPEVKNSSKSACVLLENHDNTTTELQPKEINSIENVKNTASDRDNKIKKLLKEFKKLQKTKSKQNVGTVKRIYSKVLNEGKLKTSSLHKFQVNKETNLVHKVRRVLKTKSDQLAIDKTLSSDIPIKVEPRLSPAAEPSKTVKLNRVDLNIFSNVNRNITKHERMSGIDHKVADQHDTSKLVRQPLKGTDTMHRSTTKITTEFDLSKARKLHSKKEFCKPAKLQMYGARRSIYTYSNPKTKIPQKSYVCENDTEPNMASGSLIYVCGLLPNKQTNLHTIRTQVRNLHTTGFRGKVKELAKKKRSTVIKGNGKTKSVNVDSAMRCVTDEITGNISKKIELKNDPPQSAVKNIHKMGNSKNGELYKESSLMKNEESKREPQSKMTDCEYNSTLKDTSNPSSFSSSVKTIIDDDTKVLFSRSERNDCLVPISNSKEDTPMDPNINATAPQRDGINIKSTEQGLNLDLQNIQSSQGNEPISDSPKWKSKADRLDKWKLEVESNKAEESTIADKKADEGLENNDQTEGINVDESSVTLEKEGKKKELQVGYEAKSNIQKNVKLSNDGMEKNNLKKDDKASTVCDGMEKKLKGVHESTKLSKDTVKVAIPNTNKNLSNQNKNKNNSLVIIKNESTREVDENRKNDIPNNKIKEFESKLRVLESKLKALELKSIEEANTESVSKTNAKNDRDCVKSSSHSNHITVGENKTGLKEAIKNSHPIEGNSVPQNKNKITHLTFPVKNDSRSIKKVQNDLMKEHLSQKVKTLELKLKNLETKVNNLKENPTDLANNNTDLCKTSALCKSSSEESKPPNLNKSKPIPNVSKLDERIIYLHSGNNVQTGDSNIPNKSNVGDRNKEKHGTSTIVYSKPEIYLKHYLTANKNKFGEQILSAKNKNMKKRDLLTIQSTLTELKLRNNHVKTAKNDSGNLLIQKPQPEYIQSSEISEANEIVSHVTNKTDGQQIKKCRDKSVYSPDTTVLHGKETITRKSNKGNNVEQKYVNQNTLRQKICLDSALDNKDVINIKNHKGRSLPKPTTSISIPVIQKGSSKVALKSKVSPLTNFNSNVDGEQKTTTLSTRKSKKKSTPFNVSKKAFLKGNPYQRLKKGHINFDSGIHLKARKNTLHEGLLKSTRWLKSVGSERGDLLMNVTDKVSPSSQTKLPTSRTILRPPALPKNLSKALNILKSPRKKRERNDKKVELKSDLDSTGSWKSVKDLLDSTEGPSRRERENNKFNSFDYYRPRRRSYEIKHPIEKEKLGIEFPRKNEIILDKSDPKNLSQNSTIHCEYSSKRINSGRESTELHKENDKQLNTLISHENPNRVKSVQK